MSSEKRIICPINDYYCLFEKCSEFLYSPVNNVDALAIRKVNFNELL